MRPARKKRSNGLAHNGRALHMLEELHRSLAAQLQPQTEQPRPSTGLPRKLGRQTSFGQEQSRPSTAGALGQDSVHYHAHYHCHRGRSEGELRFSRSAGSLQPLSISVEQMEDGKQSPQRMNLGALAAHAYPQHKAASASSALAGSESRRSIGSRPKVLPRTEASTPDLFAYSRSKLPSVGNSPSEGSLASTRASSARSSRPCSGSTSSGQSRPTSVTRPRPSLASRQNSGSALTNDNGRSRPPKHSAPTECELARSILLKSQSQLCLAFEPMSSPTGSDVAVAGSPAPRAARALGARYAEMAAGQSGSVAADWLRRRLAVCEPPTLEELQACEAFAKYDTNRDGQLSLQEFGELILERGLATDHGEARKVIDAATGEGEESVDVEGYVRFSANIKSRLHGYSREETLLMQSVFDQYDKNRSGLLEASEYTALLTDLGRVPRTRQDSEHLGTLIAACRQDGSLGPMRFDEFLALAWRIDNDDNENAALGKVQGSPLVSRPATKNLKA